MPANRRPPHLEENMYRIVTALFLLAVSAVTASAQGLIPAIWQGQRGSLMKVLTMDPAGNWTEDCRVTTVGQGRFVSPTTVVTRWIATYVGPNGRVVRVRGSDVFQR